MYEQIPKLKGKVKEVRSKTYLIFDETGKNDKKLDSTEKIIYDKAENIIEWQRKYSNGLISKTVNQYDEQNNLTECIVFQNELKKNRTVYQYDSDGRSNKQIYFDENDEFVGEFCPKYTKEGLRIEEKTHEPFIIEGKEVQGDIVYHLNDEINVRFSRRNVYFSKEIYETDGKLIEVTFFNQRKWTIGKIFVEYNDKNKVSKITKYGEDKTFGVNQNSFWKNMLANFAKRIYHVLLFFKNCFRFLTNRQFKKIINLIKFGSTYEEINYLYDSLGNKIETNYFTEYIDGKTIFQYDSLGNKKSEQTIYKDSYISHKETNEYEYDAYKNWIKRTSFSYFQSGNPQFTKEWKILTQRKITYQ